MARTTVRTNSGADTLLRACTGREEEIHLCLWTRDARVFARVASLVRVSRSTNSYYAYSGRAAPPPARPSCPASAAGQDRTTGTHPQPYSPLSAQRTSHTTPKQPSSRTSEQPSSHVVRRRELGSADLLHGRRLRRRSHHGRHRQDVPQGTVRHGCTRAAWWKVAAGLRRQSVEVAAIGPPAAAIHPITLTQ